MPDSYGICFTLVVFCGASQALAMIIPAAIAIATIRNRKTGVNSVPIDPRPSLTLDPLLDLCEGFHKVLPKKTPAVARFEPARHHFSNFPTLHVF